MKFATDGLEDYLTDGHAETDGITVKLSDTVSFRVRRAGGRNTEHDRAFSRYARPYLRRIRMMSNDEIRSKIVLPTYLDAVIIGWEGVFNSEGDEIPYSKEACRQFLEAFPNVFDQLIDIAGEMSSFRMQEYEDTADALGES